MLKVKEKVNEFLKKYGMDSESIDIELNSKIFLEEMQKGLLGKSSSLKMIPTYISMDGEVPVEEPVIVIDAGGTNFRVATMHFDKGKKPVIEGFRIFPMPGTKGEIRKKEFFKTIVQYIEPDLSKSKKIGFCFSYPTEILPNKDGRLIKFCKEVKVKGVEGERIGENLLIALKEMGYKADKDIVMLNDTVATLLGGRASLPERVFESYIGFILGTGTNTCYIEENKNIKKAMKIASKDGSMIVNVESGAYNMAPRGSVDIEMDMETVNPGEYLFEKMISGGYQGSLMLALIKKAAEEGLFSKNFICKIQEIEGLKSKEIDDFLYYPYSGSNLLSKICMSSVPEVFFNDHILLYYLIDAMVERAAKLVTINLSAVISKTGKGRNPCSSVCITAEGTTFYNSKLFRNKLDYYIKEYLNEEKGIFCEFVKADNATLVGTAIAALLN